MVTVIVGKRNKSDTICDILTLCEGVDSPNRAQFDASRTEKGTPK